MNKIKLPTHSDSRGRLTVVENIPFDIKRVYYIYDVDGCERGHHRHKKTVQLLVCINGYCAIEMNNGKSINTVLLASPEEGLIVRPGDWHKIYDFSKDAILMVLASEPFNEDDYIYENYD
jgi:dTDP-4-dehydrorhamnose 3,5-epimerase-like enzyme